MSLQRLILSSALAAGWMTLPAAAQTTSTPVPAPVTLTRNYVFSAVTLATSETARIIVFNAAPVPTASGATAPSCAGTLSFTPSTGASTTPVPFTLGAGQFGTASFTSSSISTPPEEVVGKVALTVDLGAQAACNLIMSLEVFDTTSGVGHVVLTSPATTGGIGPIPLPLPLQEGGR
jgi:hypothetical protein